MANCAGTQGLISYYYTDVPIAVSHPFTGKPWLYFFVANALPGAIAPEALFDALVEHARNTKRSVSAAALGIQSGDNVQVYGNESVRAQVSLGIPPVQERWCARMFSDGRICVRRFGECSDTLDLRGDEVGVSVFSFSRLYGTAS